VIARALLTRLLPAAALLLGLPAPAAMASAATSASGPVTPPCAWGTVVSATALNVFFPDTAATYWVTKFTVQDGLDITLSGRYPDSRYAQFSVYAAKGGLFTTNGVRSALTDYQIEPDHGSVNPWQHLAVAGGRFTVTLRSDPAAGQVNTLPLAPADTASGSTGYLVYRVYLPARGDFSAVPLPALTFTAGGSSQPVPVCANAASRLPAGLAAPVSRAATPAATSGTVSFTRTTTTTGVFPNADSAYLVAPVTPPGGDDVVVIRAKAPTSSTGSHPVRWPDPSADMRYWSMCDNLLDAQRSVVVNKLPGGQTDDGCRYDSQTRLDRFGYYTFVVGTEAQRAAIDRIPGTTFIPFSTADPTTTHLLMLRNMLVSPGFAQAIQNVPPGSAAAAAAAVMGPYYPQAAICPLATLAAQGPAACVPGTP
jgi:hypothetical protein